MSARLAVNMLVLNGEATLRRCLLPLKGIINELVVVDSGSTDGTQHVLEDLATEMKLDRFYYERMHPYSQDFFTDEAESWRMPMPGPFSGLRLLKDWAAARNRALDHTHADYVLKLDADDEPMSPPENWLRTCDSLDARPDISVVSCPYEIAEGLKKSCPQGKVIWLSMYDRLWRRVPTDGSSPLRWARSCHEYLTGKALKNTLYTPQGLRVRDWRDSPGLGVRVAHRNLKVLLRDHEANPRVADPVRELLTDEDRAQDLLRIFTLAHEAAPVFPEYALGLLAEVISKVDEFDKSMLADCYYHQGRALVAMGAVPAALLAYEKAYEKTHEMAPHIQALLSEYELLVKERCGPKTREATRLRERILALVGADPTGSVPFNCDLGIVEQVRNDHG